MQLRPYQEEAVHAVYDHLQNREDNPCVVLPTGSGKSIVIAQICSDTVLRWGGRLLILAHVKELLQQNADKLHRLAPNINFGIYSAGLKSRKTKEPVIIAGIQSVYNKACELGAFDLILIDEAHLLPESGEGMYRTFLKEAKVVNPNVRLIGFTATPYRMTSGLICKPRSERSETAGTDALLNDVCYEKGIKELINEGFLCRIHTRVPATKIDCSNIHIRNGEFRADEVAERFSTEEAVPTRLTVIKTSWQRFEEVIEHDFTEKPELPDTYDEEPKVCGDCGLFYQGDCPYRVGMFGEEPACEHFLSEPENNPNDDVPF